MFTTQYLFSLQDNLKHDIHVNKVFIPSGTVHILNQCFNPESGQCRIIPHEFVNDMYKRNLSILCIYFVIKNFPNSFTTPHQNTQYSLYYAADLGTTNAYFC